MIVAKSRQQMHAIHRVFLFSKAAADMLPLLK